MPSNQARCEAWMQSEPAQTMRLKQNPDMAIKHKGVGTDMATNVPSLRVPSVELVGLDGLLSWQIFTWCEISGTSRSGVMANIYMIFIAWGGDV